MVEGRTTGSIKDDTGCWMIPITRPVITEEDAEVVKQTVLSGWVSQGPEVAKFEEEFASAVSAPFACATTSGTSALQVALMSIGLTEGDEVITVSHSFIAAANAVRLCGATPVFVDIDDDTYNMDAALIEPAISKRTKAILCVHQMGMPCDLPTIIELARKHEILVIEDAACAVGSEISWHGTWERIGKPHGDIACFSFHPRKVITTGEGGMITTANADWHERFKLLRHHGMSVNDLQRHNADTPIFEEYLSVGSNYRMTDIQAALGRRQLSRLSDFVSRRRDLAARYEKLLAEIPQVGRPFEPEWARSNWQSYCVRLPDEVDQHTVMQRLLQAGISTRRGIMCTHRTEAYRDFLHPFDLSKSEDAQDHNILLPLFPQMSESDQRIIVSAIATACKFS